MLLNKKKNVSFLLFFSLLSLLFSVNCDPDLDKIKAERENSLKNLKKLPLHKNGKNPVFAFTEARTEDIPLIGQWELGNILSNHEESTKEKTKKIEALNNLAKGLAKGLAENKITFIFNANNQFSIFITQKSPESSTLNKVASGQYDCCCPGMGRVTLHDLIEENENNGLNNDRHPSLKDLSGSYHFNHDLLYKNGPLVQHNLILTGPYYGDALFSKEPKGEPSAPVALFFEKVPEEKSAIVEDL